MDNPEGRTKEEVMQYIIRFEEFGGEFAWPKKKEFRANNNQDAQKCFDEFKKTHEILQGEGLKREVQGLDRVNDDGSITTLI